jgi:hypothetical protein
MKVSCGEYSGTELPGALREVTSTLQPMKLEQPLQVMVIFMQ